jgi:hypothetical protein
MTRRSRRRAGTRGRVPAWSKLLVLVIGAVFGAGLGYRAGTSLVEAGPTRTVATVHVETPEPSPVATPAPTAAPTPVASARPVFVARVAPRAPVRQPSETTPTPKVWPLGSITAD